VHIDQGDNNVRATASADDALRSTPIESPPSGEEQLIPSNGRLTAVCTPRPVV